MHGGVEYPDLLGWKTGGSDTDTTTDTDTASDTWISWMETCVNKWGSPPQGQGDRGWLLMAGASTYVCHFVQDVSVRAVCDTLSLWHIATHCGVSVGRSCNGSKINRMLAEKETFTLGTVPCVRGKQVGSFTGWGCEKGWIRVFGEGLWTATSGRLNPWFFTQLYRA